jgi:hypothetical protein
MLRNSGERSNAQQATGLVALVGQRQYPVFIIPSEETFVRGDAIRGVIEASLDATMADIVAIISDLLEAD